jgi:hypothetical protein
MVAFAGVDIMVGTDGNEEHESLSGDTGGSEGEEDEMQRRRRRRLWLLEFNRNPAAPPPGPLSPHFKAHLVALVSALVDFSLHSKTSPFLDLEATLG